MEGTFLFLGTGASTGIPVVGCKCPVCCSRLVHNQRLRSSGLIKYGNKVLLIDCSPDFRQQALRHQVDHLDALLITHTHYDHIAGIDDLRPLFFHKNEQIPCLLSEESFQELNKHYEYLLDPKRNSWGQRHLQFQILDESGSITVQNLNIKYFSYIQCKMKVIAYRIGRFAYVTDICEYTGDIVDALQGVEQLVVSAISNRPSNAHLSIREAVAFVKQIQARQAWLTHIGHHVDHESAAALLPPNIFMGYDGLEFKINL